MALAERFQVEELKDLLEYAVKNSYKSRDNDTKGESIVNNCLRLFGKDYKYSVISNSNGELCSHYPTKIPIIEYQVSETYKANENVQSMYDFVKLKDLFSKARFARCRARFAVPVIFYEGKHICRGATISGGAEIYGRSGFDFFLTGGESIPEGEANTESNEWQLFDRIRGQDIRLLKTFSVGFICDLMVEKKKVKFGMNVTSSEKVDKLNRYADFSILSVPYPGCEFFRQWRDNCYMAEGMMFDWQQGYVDAQLDLPGNISPPRCIDWTKYRTWDLVKLTQNYLKLLLHYINEGDTGLLIHCISGWDRTPLFISLLRLSLWADGSAHASLGPLEILYLTVAYDWYLFGHHFPDRMSKGEEIFFFCFTMLKYIVTEDFSIGHSKPKSRTVSRTDSEYCMDGVLLDPEMQRGGSCRGSNTSINSSSSINSARSSVDNFPIFFSANTADDDNTVANGNPAIIGITPHRCSPSNKPDGRSKNGLSATTPVAVPNHVKNGLSATTPVAVPSHVKRMSDMKSHSPAYGSWQIISGSGSLRGSTSSQESPRSSTSEQSAQNNTVLFDPDSEDTPRKQKLDAVRRTFLSMYSSPIELPSGPDNGGISGLLGNFAEKVGIKGTRTSLV